MSWKILVSIAAYNEERTIGETIRRIKKTLSNMGDKIQYQILVVDDGSTDKTKEIAKKEGVKVIGHIINLGPGAALRTSYLYAARSDFDIVVRLDADGQHPPEYIPHLLDPILRGEADVVIGSRYLERSYKSSLLRDLGNIVHSKIISIVSQQKITDVTSGFRAIKIEVIRDIVKYDFPDTPAVYITLKKALSGYKLKEVPVKMYPRMHGKSYLNLKRLIIYPFKTVRDVIKTIVEG
ncbi:glycosyltransferase family 2 protein [Archaeoglobus sp. JdFR-39]|jgi:hypothetical protein|uniref:glycosyltransferase family 2 protein n=1 Tax=Archaeoglobus sp. JdFR-39 TaxID=1934996 RepID=UPI0025C52E60|nr:glycosyltransferase family 2 protein [Archaeoglobus sp. JdFR-39]